jgi:hypothetical protein
VKTHLASLDNFGDIKLLLTALVKNKTLHYTSLYLTALRRVAKVLVENHMKTA